MRHPRTITGLVALLALTTFLQCSNKSSPDARNTCSGRQALQTDALRGAKMDPKTLALTFDDGPGPRTKALSAFLKKEGIQAAFFVNGRSMGNDAPDILQQLVADGHLIGNHTETHRSLTGVATGEARPADADIIKEVTDTDAKISAYVPSNRFLFRPPFGDYDDLTFNVLKATPMNKYVGPVLWDIGDRMDAANGRAADWDCWQDGADGKRVAMKECGDLYIEEIKRTNWGIVLMHDPYFNEADPKQEGTVEMVMYMVPLLKADGYTFVRVDRVPEIAALLPPLPADAQSVAEDGKGQETTTPASPTTAAAADDPCK